MGNLEATFDQWLDRAADCSQSGQHGAAGVALLHALEVAESKSVGSDRTQQLSLLANLCERVGHPDLALMAIKDLLETVNEESDPDQRCTNLLALANSWYQLGQLTAAEVTNEAALAHALAHLRWADAASANTNLAIAAANSGRLQDAHKRLQRSLGYLKKDDGNPDTDAITRLALLNVVDALEVDPKPALDASRCLFTRLAPQVGAARWAQAAPAFHRLVDRYLAGHVELDPLTWKQHTFPAIYGDAS